MKKGLFVLALVAAVVVAFFALYKYYGAAVSRKPAEAVTETVVVPPGYTTAEIATLLVDEALRVVLPRERPRRETPGRRIRIIE